MRGRPPLPTALKILRGNPGGRKLHKERKPGGKPTCPDWLIDRAKEIWEARAPELIEHGILTARDTELFAAFCQELALYEGFNQMCQGKRPDTVIRKGYLSRAKQHLENAHKLGARFGMTPSDRVRVHVPEKPKPDDEDFLFGRRHA